MSNERTNPARVTGGAASGYAQLRTVRRRLNIDDSVTAVNDKIEDFMREADNYVNNQVNLHAITPIDDVDEELVSLASGTAAAIYNYWQTPAKDRNLEQIGDWKKSIQDHILANYGRKNPNLLTGGDTFGQTNRATGNEFSGTG